SGEPCLKPSLGPLLDRVSDLVYLVEVGDDGVRIIDVNRANLEILGLSRDAIVDHLVEDVFLAPAAKRFKTHVLRALGAGRTVRYEEDIFDPALPKGRL